MKASNKKIKAKFRYSCNLHRTSNFASILLLLWLIENLNFWEIEEKLKKIGKLNFLFNFPMRAKELEKNPNLSLFFGLFSDRQKV